MLCLKNPIRGLLQSMSHRKNLSEQTMERAIRIALDNGEAISVLRNLTNCRNFYSSELLDVFIELASEGKLH